MEKLKPKVDIYAGPKRLEEKMEQQLCNKCLSHYKVYYGGCTLIPPNQHCHHPEEPEKLPEPEKPPCKWCEEWRYIKLTWHGTPFWKQLSYLINGSDKEITECPVCGAKI